MDDNLDVHTRDAVKKVLQTGLIDGGLVASRQADQ